MAEHHKAVRISRTCKAGAVFEACDEVRAYEMRYNHNHDEKGRFCSGDGVDKGGNSGIIGDNKVFYTHDDPMQDKLGSAENSHPELLKSFIDYAESRGVNILYHSGNKTMAYQPGLLQGQPGQLCMAEGASISAWIHEMQHLYDDEECGWSGIKVLFDRDEHWRREKRAYNAEIKLAKSLGFDDVVAALESLKEDERMRIYDESNS